MTQPRRAAFFSRLTLLTALTLPFAYSPVVFALPKPDRAGVGNTGPYDYGVMGPPARGAIVARADKAVAAPMPPGPFQPTWESIGKNYQSPSWFEGAKFGIFMHWGLYSVPAYHNEWYEKHMYGSSEIRKWHHEHFGPVREFGYKDFIPLFTAAQWDPDAWAELFRKSGARLVMPCAQHHDNFALWDSNVTPFNAKRMGPKRDLMGDLAVSVRKQGMKFGLSNHGVENFSFIDPPDALLNELREAGADLFDPEWAEFYNVADRSDDAQARFLTDWVNRNLELIDKYQPDLLWFDNGVNLRLLDPLKLRVAAYYYNRAREWEKEVSLSTKFIAYAPSNIDTEQIGSIIDFEKVGNRSPADIRRGPWMVDDPIGSTWGYTTGMSVSSADAIIRRLVETVSKGGFYLLNISPKADGSIPEAQQTTLLGIGAWLEQNGEAIFGTRPWTQFHERASRRGEPDFHFTTKDDALYAIGSTWPGTGTAFVDSLPDALVTVEEVELLGVNEPLSFAQDASGLEVSLPARQPGNHSFTLKITGRGMNSSP